LASAARVRPSGTFAHVTRIPSLAQDEAFETLVAADPADTSACLVYADWLEEQGDDVMASGYRLLGGLIPSGTAESQRWIGLGAVTAATLLLVSTPGFATEADRAQTRRYSTSSGHGFGHPHARFGLRPHAKHLRMDHSPCVIVQASRSTQTCR
jgi:uncharacterized protein (TIGR02996 family)